MPGLCTFHCAGLSTKCPGGMRGRGGFEPCLSSRALPVALTRLLPALLPATLRSHFRHCGQSGCRDITGGIYLLEKDRELPSFLPCSLPCSPLCRPCSTPTLGSSPRTPPQRGWGCPWLPSPKYHSLLSFCSLCKIHIWGVSRRNLPVGL